MEGWCVHVILKASCRRTGSISDYHVLFFNSEKEQLNALLQVAQVSLTVILFVWLLLSICEGSFIAYASPGANIVIVATLFKKQALFTQNLQVFGFGRGA